MGGGLVAHPRMMRGPPSVKRSHMLVELAQRGRRRDAVPARDKDMEAREGMGVPSNDTRMCLEAVWDSLRWCTLPIWPRPATSTDDARLDPE